MTKQIRTIQRILNNSRLHVCACGFQCMPMVLNKGYFVCPECDRNNEVK